MTKKAGSLFPTPMYRLHNAALGVYGDETKASYLATVNAFRDAYYAGETAINEAESYDAVDSAVIATEAAYDEIEIITE